MLVRDIISANIKPLRVIDTAGEALSAMNEMGQGVLPVVDLTTNRLIGMVSRASAEKHSTTVDSVLAIRDKNVITISPSQNIFDSARMMKKHNVAMIPVLDDEQNYLGVIERSVLYARVVELMNLTEYGSLITIHFEERDFTLSQIVRIIENEGGLILGLHVESPRDNNPFYIINIKLNLPDPTRIVSALKRHEYIVDFQSLDDRDDKRYEERANELLHYLNM